MIALADQSTMPQWSALGWGFLFGFVLVAVIINALFGRRDADKPVDLWPVDLDAPVEFYVVCPTRGCRYPARVKVESFTGLVTVCHGCADEGIAHGWFTAA